MISVEKNCLLITLIGVFLYFLHCLGKILVKYFDRDRSRTCNPRIRSTVPYPLGHTILVIHKSREFKIELQAATVDYGEIAILFSLVWSAFLIMIKINFEYYFTLFQNENYYI